MIDLKGLIRDVPDFPQPGIIFRDVTTLLKDGRAFVEVIDAFQRRYEDRSIDVVLGIESRGFILGGALAYRLGCGFVPARKPGKLPAETLKVEYDLEYGQDALEIHRDAIQEGQSVVVMDDLLATGGTALAACQLVERLGGVVEEIAFLIELGFLGGRDKFKGYKVFSLVNYKFAGKP